MPWSAKAEELLRAQYGAVGAAARHVLPAAMGALDQAAGAGLDVAGLTERTKARAANAEAFTAAYRRYCWPVDGLDGVRFAPFQLLATEGASYSDRPHAWHLAVADRLAAAETELIATTRRLVADTTDPGSLAAATAWWEQLTADGGEGMVVKPAANLVRGRRGLVQPGLKVRGTEYLRIIYGPDYAEPANLDRLRSRGLGTSARWPRGSTRSGLRRSTGSPGASRSGGCTSACSLSSPSSPSRSTRGCNGRLPSRDGSGRLC